MKAVLIDYTGTMMQEGGADMAEVVKCFCTGSDVHDPKEAIAYWWRVLKQYEVSSSGEKFLTEDEIVDRILEQSEREIHLKGNLEEIHKMCRRFWTDAPLFEDVKEFFQSCPLPIYIVTNIGAEYVEKAMQKNDLHPAGIICSDMVRMHKPHKELFEKALEISGCRADEVLHIGDSMESDVIGAKAAGIRPIFLDRTGKKEAESADIERVTSLTEVLQML